MRPSITRRILQTLWILLKKSVVGTLEFVGVLLLLVVGCALVMAILYGAGWTMGHIFPSLATLSGGANDVDRNVGIGFLTLAAGVILLFVLVLITKSFETIVHAWRKTGRL